MQLRQAQAIAAVAIPLAARANRETCGVVSDGGEDLGGEVRNVSFRRARGTVVGFVE
jgi:hypothetical protein